MLTSGSRIGPYEIGGRLGAGGMGEVYRARDTNLNRDVALKILLPEVANDPDRIARFRREAQVLASLNHPHIAQIYGLEEAVVGGTRVTALAMELVDGPTLADLLGGTASGVGLQAPGVSIQRDSGLGPKSGAQNPEPRARTRRLPINEALAIARQIADALEAAHDQGIVHRDLKPANVKVRADGTVKVLDFGLAKAIGPSAASGLQAAPSISPTLTSPALATAAGAILGTAAYMSPEQARGRLVDKRTDIWAFGCVLYEMLAGRRAFVPKDGVDDVVAVLAAIVRDEPDWELLPRNVPPGVLRLLHRALEKDPRKRLRDIGDGRLELDDREEPASVAREEARRGSPRRLALTMAGIGVAGLLVGAGAVRFGMGANSPRRDTAPIMQLTVPIPRLPRTFAAVFGAASPAAISPDASRIVFGLDGLYVQPLSSMQATLIPNTERANDPFFSPDGQSIGYNARRQLFAMSLATSAPVALAPVNYFTGGRWSADGYIYYTDSAAGLFRVKATGGQPELVVPPQQGEVMIFPEILPGSDWILFSSAPGSSMAAQGHLIAANMRTHERRVLADGGAARYFKGQLLYAALGATINLVPFDASRATFVGSPHVFSTAEFPDIVASPDVADDGTLLWVSLSTTNAMRKPVWVTRDGVETPLPFDEKRFSFPHLSPDGRRILMSTADPSTGGVDVWAYDVDGSGATRLTFDGKSSSAIWSPDGARVAYAGADGVLYVRAVDGSTQPRTLGSGTSRYPYAWTPDGRSVIFTQLTGNALDIGVVDVADGEHARMLLATRANETRPALSPDGHWVAYSSDESGRAEVYVRPFPNVDGGQWQVSTAGGTSPVWSRDGHEVMFRGAGHVMAASRRQGAGMSFDAPRQLFEDNYVNETGGSSYEIAADGRILMLKESNGSAALHVTLNWFGDRTRQAGTK